MSDTANALPTVAVMGGGHAAFAHAADLGTRGFDVRLFEVPALAETIAGAKEAGGILSQPDPTTGLIAGFGQVKLVTTDPAAALNGADVAFIVVPAFAHRSFAQLIAPHVRPEQILVLSPGNFGGAVMFARWLKEFGCQTLPHLAEAQSMIYACRKDGPASVKIFGYKRGLRIAVFPATHTDPVIARLRQVFPTLEAAPNVLWTWLSNPNAIIHPPVTILNAGRIEQTHGDFLFYVQGITPAVRKVMDVLDAERIALGRALGLTLISQHELGVIFYGHQGYVGEAFPDKARNPVYHAIKAEGELDSRYLTEDVPYGLVPWEELARLTGVEMPICTSLINIANSLLGRDFRATGQTLERVGLAGLSIAEIQKLVEQGV